MALLSKDQILTAPDIQTEDVDVPEWGGTVRLRGLSGAEREAWEQSMLVAGPNGTRIQRPGAVDTRARLLVRCIIDTDDELMFTDADIPALNAKAAAGLDRLVDVARRLSRLGKQEEAAAEGNSRAADSGSSTTA
ncbi:hypothetical protein OG401_21010 [Kitasatospora purpeofusca]|uniref:hypothetical protein n=1 Tax=Kitasatospora purpeofusca TaxID=67352 RepID=UPI0022586242|nr:hypothetical protein [Kitasatospora purpeofusca]MCX4686761.1 hypothetical protein [Kitasatospora purpeofusca]